MFPHSDTICMLGYPRLPAEAAIRGEPPTRRQRPGRDAPPVILSASGQRVTATLFANRVGRARLASGAAVTSADDGLGASGPVPDPPFRHGTCDNPPALGKGWQAMADATRAHVWGNTATYEAYMGRWSRPVAEAVLAWLGLPPGLTWLDVGCGTGALTEVILDAADPREILGVDPSADFLATAAGADCRSARPLPSRSGMRARCRCRRRLRRGRRRPGPALRARPAGGRRGDGARRPSRRHGGRLRLGPRR